MEAAEAHLSLHLSKCQIVGNLMLRLKFNGIHSLDIVHLNTRSIRNKLDYLPNLVESFQTTYVTETHLDADISSSNLILEGFNEPLRKNRSRNGEEIFVREYMSNLLKYNRRHVLESTNIETILVEIELNFTIVLPV